MTKIAKKIFQCQNGVIIVAGLLSTGFLGNEETRKLGNEEIRSVISGRSYPCFLVSSFPYWLIYGLFLILILSRLYPFLLSSTPFGYATGIYRYEFWQSFSALPEFVSNIFLGLP